MSIQPLRLVAALPTFALACLSVTVPAQVSPVGFEERFALADDREAALTQLVPGTEDAFFYQCLHLQNSGALSEVPALLDQWSQRIGTSPRFDEIEHRQALLSFRRDPDRTYAFLKEHLSLSFDHRQELPGASIDLPSRLDPQLITWESYSTRALEAANGSFDGFRAGAVDAVNAAELDRASLHGWLQRLSRPDHPQLAALVIRDLNARIGGGFGSLAIHRALLLSQLEQCAELSPTLLDDPDFVAAWLRRLRPGADSDWTADAGQRGEYLQRLVDFSERLSPSQNSLKAHVLYWQLEHERRQGRFDRARFLQYLRLPRHDGLGNPGDPKRTARASALVSFSQSYPTGLKVIGTDQALVEAYLAHFFRAGEGFDLYAEFLREDYVRRVYAETGLLYGVGDPLELNDLLDDREALADLRDRVEIELAPGQPLSFGAHDAVAIDVEVKNVPTLLVKIFEIDTFGYYTAEQREVDPNIVLDGLVANEEFTVSYDESPMRRVRRHFELPALERPGVFVVEFVGNGLASRAVIHKGRLRLLERLGSAGHVFRVLDDDGELLREASLWIAKHLYTADELGEVVVPYSSAGGTRAIVLRHGDRASLASFQHREERYELKAAMFVDREGLMERRTAKLLVRPTLFINGQPASLELLESPRLHLVSEDQEGLSSVWDVTDLKLSYDGEWVQELDVPPGLVSLTAQLMGSVANLSRGRDQQLSSDSVTFELNLVDGTAQVSGALLGRSESGYVLDMLGKNGEPIAGRALALALRHPDFIDDLQVFLKTDEGGRVELGELSGLSAVRLLGEPHTHDLWELLHDVAILPSRLDGLVGETLRLPSLGQAQTIDRSVLSLLELRDGVYAIDRRDHAHLADGYIELRGLPAGRYELFLKGEQHTVAVQLTEGRRSDDWIVGPRWVLPAQDSPSLQITDVQLTDDGLTVKLSGTSRDARVHLVASRYLPAYDPWLFLAVSQPGRAEPLQVDQPSSSYVAGRQLSDEVRYILERRFETKFPGNMLRRPSLLLNPWTLEVTGTVVGVGGAGGGFDGRGKRGSRGGSYRAPAGPPPRATRSPNLFANLEFLSQPSVTLANLRPDATGVVRVPLSELGSGQVLSIVAVQGDQTVFRSLTLPEQPLRTRERRLTAAIAKDRHVSEQRRIDYLAEGETATLADVATSEAEVYDSLPSVFELFQSLGGGQELDSFSDLMRWPELDEGERLAFYSEFACHELHLFLHQKDRGFFDAVVRPYLANKLDKTFLDHWLLDHDLARYWQPWEFNQLNIVERILLARRTPGEAAAVTRQLSEMMELMPPQTALQRRRFETALAGAALDTGSSLGKQLAAAAEALSEPDLDALRALGYIGDESGSPALLTGRGRKLPQDAARRSSQRALFASPDQTREFVEHNYWHRLIKEQDGGLIPVNAFWLDFAATAPGQPFLSTELTEPVGHVNEMLLALSLLDLPMEGAGVQTTVDGGRMALTAAGPLLLVRKELADTELASDPAPILISQNLYRLDERYVFEGFERLDKFVTGEFLTGVAYGCQVVITNPGSAVLELELLSQIPRGAISLSGGQPTSGLDLRLGAHGTTSLEYAFYFPRPGSFEHYPAHVSRDGSVVAFTEPRTLTVVAERTTTDATSWEYVSQQGSDEEVWSFLSEANLYRVDLSRLAWRLADKNFFDEAIALLSARHVFSPLVWSYAVHHRDQAAARDLVANSFGFVARCGPWLDSPLLTIDPVARRFYQHIEYAPLLTARAHRFGPARQILTSSFAVQYSELMQRLAHRPRLDDQDWLEVTYAMLLQDRVEEALAAFERVDQGALDTQLQLDAVRAYLAFYRSDYAAARAIAEQHREHPVSRWRARFVEILAHLDEAEGLTPGVGGSGLGGGQDALVASEPSLELEVSHGTITLRHANLERCEVRYSQRDIELLFSTAPFAAPSSSASAAIRPNRVDRLELDPEGGTTVFELPEELAGANVLVEVRAAGLVRRQVSEPSALLVQIIENYGQLKVTHEKGGRPVVGAYVKVYAKLDEGEVLFHKDGYTDLRGRFDYVSVSGGDEFDPEHFAILVLSEDVGAVVREVGAPLE